MAESVAAMGLKYATVTGVARDDLTDGGAWLYAQVCREIHAAVPGCGVELLIPDFNAEPGRLAEVFSAEPEVLAHNIETVPRIFRRIRPGFRYSRSLDVLRAAREAQLVTKSNLILGLGEERHEITEAMRDLRAVGCELLTITQYLRPTRRHHPVERWVKPEEFVELRTEALGLGFTGVMSGPLVRSSYRAGRLYAQAAERREGLGWHRGFCPGRRNRMLRSMARMSRKSGSADQAATMESAAEMANAGRLKQIRMVAGLVHRQNPRAMPIVFGSGLGILAVLVIVGVLTGLPALLIPLGVLLGLLVAMLLFGRFAQAAQYSSIEGQPGAAAAVLENMRGNWTVTPAIAANRNMDVVHRAVGRPGVILVGEGSPTRLTTLLAAEKKRVARVAYEVPIFEFQVGNEEGQIALSKLQRKVMRLPRNLKPAAVSDLNHRLKALQPSLQAPKGPIPRNIRQPKMPRPKTR